MGGLRTWRQDGSAERAGRSQPSGPWPRSPPRPQGRRRRPGGRRPVLGRRSSHRARSTAPPGPDTRRRHVRGTAIVGRSGSIPARRLDLEPELFVTGPSGGTVLTGSDDGRRSRLSLIDVAAGCAWSLGSSTDVIRNGVLAADGGSIVESRVDRRTRADLGVWRRPLDRSSPARLLPPIAADDRFGPTWLTELAWGDDGSTLVVGSCGETACRYRLLPDTGGGHDDRGPGRGFSRGSRRRPARGARCMSRPAVSDRVGRCPRPWACVACGCGRARHPRPRRWRSIAGRVRVRSGRIHARVDRTRWPRRGHPRHSATGAASGRRCVVVGRISPNTLPRRSSSGPTDGCRSTDRDGRLCVRSPVGRRSRLMRCFDESLPTARIGAGEPRWSSPWRRRP